MYAGGYTRRTVWYLNCIEQVYRGTPSHEEIVPRGKCPLCAVSPAASVLRRYLRAVPPTPTCGLVIKALYDRRFGMNCVNYRHRRRSVNSVASCMAFYARHFLCAKPSAPLEHLLRHHIFFVTNIFCGIHSEPPSGFSARLLKLH